MSVYFAKNKVVVSQQVYDGFVDDRSRTTLVHIVDVWNSCSVKSSAICPDFKF